jgi:hypothetical protein
VNLALGPFRFLSFSGDLEELAAGKEREGALQDLDARLPAGNSLRRTCDETKAAVVAAFELLRAEKLPVTSRLGLYVGQQQIALEYCSKFIETSYREGPRMASPMQFSESVANNAATHLSLTLGMTGLAQTFIGCRVAGIQAVQGAAEDVADGTVDAGLVVVLGTNSMLAREAYRAVNRPMQRRSPDEGRYLRGVVAVLVRREAPGQPRLVYAGVRCGGREPGQQIRTVGSLWTEAELRMKDGTRVVESTLNMARSRSLGVIRRIGETAQVSVSLGESYALDPFAKLLLDSRMHAGEEGRAVLCLGEEGTAGMLALDGPARSLNL